MFYSFVALVAIMLLLVVNFDVLFLANTSELKIAERPYQLYLYGILFFYIVDFSWGVLDEHALVIPLYIATALYFLAMSVVIFLWTRFVVFYLQRNDFYGRVLKFLGWLWLITQCIILVCNLFYPIMFTISPDGTFHGLFFRYLQLDAQILLYFFASIYSLILGNSTDAKIRHRYRSIGVAGLLVSVFLGIQVFIPLYAFSSLGYMLGTCLLHTFVLEDERREQNVELRKLLVQERCQREELERTRKMAFIDSLTGVRNQSAYAEYEMQIDERISGGSLQQMGVIVFDLNNLKDVNDMFGHEAGDRYIKEGCHLICKTFAHSPVFRIGGDEFVVILEGDDYRDREGLLQSFDEIMDYNNVHDAVVIATGMEEYKPGADFCYQGFFDRADKKMYERKQQLKAKKA